MRGVKPRSVRAYAPAELERLLFRRQFLLGPDDVAGFPGWSRRTIAGTHHLVAHPDLEVTHLEAGGKSLTMLGYMLDADVPLASNERIVGDLLRQLEHSADAAVLTARLGGRWVLVVHDGSRTLLLHDAAGLRQIYFTTAEASKGRAPVCGSQPGLIAELLTLAPDPEALDYIRSLGDSDFGAYYLPGDTSPYREIKALLPNHWLDLASGRAERYWPTHSIPVVPYAEALTESVRSLRGFIDAARHRYRLAVSMTAGWDSRLMLALSRGSERDAFYFTITYPSLGKDSRDAVVPAKLLGKLGLAHHLIPYPRAIDPSFKTISKRNTNALEEPYCADAQALYELVPGERICVTGDVAEVVKAHFRFPGRTVEQLKAADLAAYCPGGSHPFALKALESWLAGARGLDAIDIGDLFNWEYMAGRWQALIRTQFDIVHESFAPLNCRALLCTMLAAEERRRAGPEFQLFKDIMDRLWADVLLVPINPPQKIPWRMQLADAFYESRIRQMVPQSVRDVAKRLLRRRHAPTT